MREREIEKYLTSRVKEMEGMCMKWTGTPGAPDRVVVMPGGLIYFVELKAPDGKLSAIQRALHCKMIERGAAVSVLYSKKDVDEFISYLR